MVLYSTDKYGKNQYSTVQYIYNSIYVPSITGISYQILKEKAKIRKNDIYKIRQQSKLKMPQKILSCRVGATLDSEIYLTQLMYTKYSKSHLGIRHPDGGRLLLLNQVSYLQQYIILNRSTWLSCISLWVSSWVWKWVRLYEYDLLLYQLTATVVVWMYTVVCEYIVNTRDPTWLSAYGCNVSITTCVTMCKWF